MKVFEIIYDHQYQGHSYGLFSTLEKAEKFLKECCMVDVGFKTIYPTSIHYQNNYIVNIRDVS